MTYQHASTTGPRVVLLTNGSATSSWTAWDGGTGIFSAVGTFGGATVSLQFRAPDDSTAITAGTETTLTATGAGGFLLHRCLIRALVSGGSPSGLYVTAEKA